MRIGGLKKHDERAYIGCLNNIVESPYKSWKSYVMKTIWESSDGFVSIIPWSASFPGKAMNLQMGPVPPVGLNLERFGPKISMNWWMMWLNQSAKNSRSPMWNSWKAVMVVHRDVRCGRSKQLNVRCSKDHLIMFSIVSSSCLTYWNPWTYKKSIEWSPPGTE